MKIKILKNKSKEKESVNNSISIQNTKKKINLKQQLKELGYKTNINSKNEQIETMNKIIHNLKNELNKYHIEKYKEKELNDIKKEVKIQNTAKIFENSYLKVKEKEIQVYIDGTKNLDNGKELKSVKIMRKIGNQRKSNFASNNNSNYNSNNNSNNNSSIKNGLRKTNTYSSLQKGKRK